MTKLTEYEVMEALSNGAQVEVGLPSFVAGSDLSHAVLQKIALVSESANSSSRPDDQKFAMEHSTLDTKIDELRTLNGPSLDVFRAELVANVMPQGYLMFEDQGRLFYLNADPQADVRLVSARIKSGPSLERKTAMYTSLNAPTYQDMIADGKIIRLHAQDNGNLLYEVKDGNGIMVVAADTSAIQKSVLPYVDGSVDVRAKKDYFANPKANGYRALHLTVGMQDPLSGANLVGELQVKTVADFRNAVQGVAAEYKHAGSRSTDQRLLEFCKEHLRVPQGTTLYSVPHRSAA